MSRLHPFDLFRGVVAALLLSGTAVGADPSEFVEVATIAPQIVIDLRYATDDNFFGKKLYPDNRCHLRRGTAEKLLKVQTELEKRGLGLKIWDAYRPLSVQQEMWKIKPDSRYVARPGTGSRHNRGAAVDVTLVDKNGAELEMPTAFDDFSERAASNSNEGTGTSRANREILKTAMLKNGFSGIDSEWWHYDDAEWKKYPIADAVPVKGEPANIPPPDDGKVIKAEVQPDIPPEATLKSRD